MWPPTDKALRNSLCRPARPLPSLLPVGLIDSLDPRLAHRCTRAHENKIGSSSSRQRHLADRFLPRGEDKTEAKPSLLETKKSSNETQADPLPSPPLPYCTFRLNSL